MKWKQWSRKWRKKKETKYVYRIHSLEHVHEHTFIHKIPVKNHNSFLCA